MMSRKLGLLVCATVASLLSGSAIGQAVGVGRQRPPEPGTGSRVEWRGWDFRWSVRDREGLVISDVYFQGRKVLKFAGVAEIFTGYDEGEPRILDIDDGGLGTNKMKLQRGADCSSGEWCKVYDAGGREQANDGRAFVMMHEERTGPNYLGGAGRIPGRVLVLWMASRFEGPPDGYTFVVKWKFRDDGMIIPEVGATGVPQHLQEGDTSEFGANIGREDNRKVFAPAHVHQFLYRLDFDVDGVENVVEEFNREQVRGQVRNTWKTLSTEGGREWKPETFRSWRVVNRRSRNALGHPRSYQIIPSAGGVFRSGAPQGFDDEPALEADLWVTLYKPAEYSRTSGDRRPAMTALPRYANGEPVEDKDVVLWYWMGFHHFPRSEDWIRQPMMWHSFQIMPRDFLDGSPLEPAK
jgi:primary-amine oxidase